MARTQSAVLSKEEKKNMITGLKATIKEAKAAVKISTANKKAAEKAHAAAMKLADKDLSATIKALESYEAQLAALTAPAA
jgi:2-phospho-L-lactate guanylyltransferase (CobY/MobA/RfbA family)